ncbi:flagellin [Acidovorax sp. CCYZU-2555]|uniref:flagellin n=1 Tax=Acidovorax sp. CCYZU-2555 TaxID=2835042 RepID=UPI001BD03349|nr:flagellin [Acidovorax sp. CCYZU-2555]MBS7781189.1 flagellin [Acidovorax sp. CCYZU-2555]
MAMTINTNVASINAQRNLSLSGSSLSTSMQRLSSGLRVNSAKDDAAGLAISERMAAQTKGLTVAARNANDGISLAQTAEGALGKVGDMLQRVRELAVQSSNATNSESDRKAMQSEVTQLVSEIDRVAKTTEFNGKKLLDGSFSGAMFQVGANAGNNITLGAITKATADNMGKLTYSSSDASGTIDVAGAAIAVEGLTMTVTGGSAIDLGDLAAASSVEERTGQVVAAINAKTADTGVTAFMNDDGTYALYSEADKSGTAVADVTFAATAGGTEASMGFDVGAVTLTEGADDTLSTLSVATQADAWKALQQVDGAIDKVNSARGDLGALQTRFEKTVENIDIQNENISAAKGRITDADFAVETANLSRSQILQQAGTAMVAQANQLPQSVLSLLR